MLSKLRLFLTAFLMLAMGAAANATAYSYTPSDADLGDLDHDYAYSWGIKDTALYNQLNNGYVITSASITIKNIWDWRVESDILYVSLLDNVKNGVKTYYDNEGGGNYFGSAVQVGTWSDPWGGNPNKAIDLTFNFSNSLLTTLTNYIKNGLGGTNNGYFGLGFDPDCHYYNTGVCFNITTALPTPPQEPTVPEPATMSLLGLGLAGMGAAARRRRQKLAA